MDSARVTALIVVVVRHLIPEVIGIRSDAGDDARLEVNQLEPSPNRVLELPMTVVGVKKR